MRFRCLLAGAFALSIFVALPLTALAQSRYTYQTPSEQYLSVRRLYPPSLELTPEIIARNPGRYRGFTLEVEGSLAGVVQTGEGGAILMLNSERDGHLNLTMSVLPTWVQPGARLRVLVVIVGEDKDEVVAGLPDMQVVALASASDIAAAEMRWRAEAANRAARAKQREAGLKAAQAQLSRVPRSMASSRSRATSVARGLSRYQQYLSSEAQGVHPLYQAFVQQHNPRLSGEQADAIAASILLYSERYDLDPRLMVALLIAESDFRPAETSNKGAMGLGQLMPDEVERLKLSNPYDPIQNIGGAAFLLKERLNKYSGSGAFKDASMQHIVLALASYNAGMGAVKKYGGVPPYRETQNYVKKIERIYRQLCQNDGG
jgi:soluble lytic murein transglycosylase-like protein